MAFEVPALPYDYAALEPHIDEQTMRVHHDKHHQAYVDNANKALEGTEWADRPAEDVLQSLDELPEDIRMAARNNVGGHANHSMFWEIMSPDGGEPGGALAQAIETHVRWAGPARRAGERRRRQALRQRLVVARGRRRLPRAHLDTEPGLADQRGEDPDSRHRRLGARLLPQVPESPSGLPGCLVERGQLARGCEALRRRSLKKTGFKTDKRTDLQGGRSDENCGCHSFRVASP